MKRLILFATIALTLAALLGASGTASAADAVSLRLNWYLGGLHAPFYLGVERGYYRDEGIDLTINEGRGSPASVQIVGAKSDTFGMTDAGSLMLGATKGVPIRSMFSLLSSSDFGIISLEETGIKSPKDLEGKSVAGTSGDGPTALFPAVCETNGVNKDKVKVVFMDPPAKPAALMEKRVDALLGGASDQYWLIKYKGFKPTHPEVCGYRRGHDRHDHRRPHGYPQGQAGPRAAIRQGDDPLLGGGPERPGGGREGGAEDQVGSERRFHPGPAADQPERAVLQELAGQVRRLFRSRRTGTTPWSCSRSTGICRRTSRRASSIRTTICPNDEPKSLESADSHRYGDARER